MRNSLNPRFDGAFLNYRDDKKCYYIYVLIPDLMGLFWIEKSWKELRIWSCLNPRFDGAFLNCNRVNSLMIDISVLIPDLMGLFWIRGDSGELFHEFKS